ncbi:MAG TPA: hypothetical protein VGL20_00750 [Candidatus Dormibacteraeota bacterium]
MSSRVSDRLRPVWSWGTNGAEAGTRSAPPEGEAGARGAPTPEPGTIELVGRAVERPSWAWGGGQRDGEAAPAVAEPAPAAAEPAAASPPAGPPPWCWDATVVMEVIPEPPAPWSWAAVTAGMEVVAPAPPASPLPPLPRSTAPAPPATGAAPAPRWTWGSNAGSTPAAAAPSAPPWRSASSPAAPTATPAPAAAGGPPIAALLVIAVLVTGWALTFSTARAVAVMPVMALYLLVIAARSAAARLDHGVEAALLGAGFLLAVGGRLVAAWTLGWLVVLLTALELAGLSLGSMLIRG